MREDLIACKLTLGDEQSGKCKIRSAQPGVLSNLYSISYILSACTRLLHSAVDEGFTSRGMSNSLAGDRSEAVKRCRRVWVYVAVSSSDTGGGRRPG